MIDHSIRSLLLQGITTLTWSPAKAVHLG